MGFPRVKGHNGGDTGGATCDHYIKLPSGVTAQDLLIVLWCVDGTPDFYWPSGWTTLFAATSGGAIRVVCRYRIADGTEGEGFWVSTEPIAKASSHLSYRITGYQGTPYCPSPTTGNSAQPDPPPLGISGDPVDRLWIALCAYDNGIYSISSYPTNYTDGLNYRWNNSAGTGVGSAIRKYTASYENPGPFTLSARQTYWVAGTIAVDGGPVLTAKSESQGFSGSHSHGEERLDSETPRGLGPVPRAPHRVTWAHFYPAGLRVLPKGSSPAGQGEINWENTLPGQFALAMERLEGLLYALFGSRPAAYPAGGGQWHKCQWYDRVHPRCLWGPEIWEQRFLGWKTEPGGSYYWDFYPTGREYAALGQEPACCPQPRPQVPIRSRSGDPAGQYRNGQWIGYSVGKHNRTYFPLGSVGRTEGAAVYDPEGKGWFGATQPGRPEENKPPWLTTANGYTWKPGEDVEFSWQPPSGLPTIRGVWLHYRLRLPGQAWGDWQIASMSLQSGAYRAVVPAQPHDTRCRWYIEVQAEPDVTVYDPGGDAPPSHAAAYRFQWFTHYNPYANGLPEMLSNYGGVDIRHGTDYYTFEGAEEVQPALLNLVRFVLNWLGSNCCAQEYDGECWETWERCDAVHHNPRFRGDDDGLCCIPMPIRFRWSGSNRVGHYVRSGKGAPGGDPSDPRPLHNHPEHTPGPGEQWGYEASRKAWRGIKVLYTDEQHFGNPLYGSGYSWGTAPGTYPLLYFPTYASYPKVHASYGYWGLRDGDVIEAVHLREIVDAVDYLIRYGVWTTTELCTRPRTPSTYGGASCGEEYSETRWRAIECSNIIERYSIEHVTNIAESQCCQTYPYDPGYTRYVESNDCNNNVTSSQENFGTPCAPGCGSPCEPWAKPTYEDCVNECQHSSCAMTATRYAKGGWNLTGQSPPRDWKWTVVKDYSTECTGGILDGGAHHMNSRRCWYWDGDSWELGGNNRYECFRDTGGFSFWACPPPRCRNGWDDDHGEGYHKRRVDHPPTNQNWHEPYTVDTGPHSGNCFGDIFCCGNTYPGQGDTGCWFGPEVVGVEYRGLGYGRWYSGCTGFPEHGDPDNRCPWEAESVLTLPPPIPGLGYHDSDENPLCEVVWHQPWHGGTLMNPTLDQHQCGCSLGDFPVCKREEVWVAVDLNLDGQGRPYYNFRGRNGELPEYTGRGVPFLKPYSLEVEPTGLRYQCPCETWTNETLCTNE